MPTAAPAVRPESDTPSVADIRRSLIENGYRITAADGKRPLAENWQQTVLTVDEVEDYTRRYANQTNTGIVCTNVVGIDIDAPDHDVCAALVVALSEIVPEAMDAPTRFGNRPKRLHLVRTSEPHPKVQSDAYLVNGIKHQVEFFGERSQFIGYGTHPDTGRDYEWVNGSPLEVPVSDLPIVTPEQLHAYRSRVEEILAARGELNKRGSRAAANDNRPAPAVAAVGDGPWDEVKARAFANLAGWVPALGLEGLKRYGSGFKAVASFRPSTGTRKRREHSLSIQPVGIYDHAPQQAYSPVDLVAVCLGLSPAEAVDWLRARVGGDVRSNESEDWISPEAAHDMAMRLAATATAKATPSPEAADANTTVPAEPRPLSIFDWPVSRFVGEAPKVEYLVDGVVPLGIPGMVSAMGDTGKSFALLELHRRVAFGQSTFAAPIFGGKVVAEGTSVMITSEDDANEVHRRIAALDDKGFRFGKAGQRMIVVPLPSAGGARAFWREDKKRGLIETDDFLRIRDELRSIPDLRLITFDPLASFAHLPLNEDPAAGQFVCTSLSRLATETGATTLVAHHMRKVAKPIENLGDARDAIRGSTALVDGLRLAYAMWPAEEARAKRICKDLGTDFQPAKVVLGGVVKANGAARRIVSTYVRNVHGLLVDRTAGLGASAPPQDDLRAALVIAVEAAAAAGSPFTKTGASGLYDMRERLPEELRVLAKAKLDTLAGQALERGEIVRAAARGEKVAKWLDVPSGQFAIGLGNFSAGTPRT